MKRYAIIKNADSRRQLEAYLPGNYEIVYEYTSMDDSRNPLRFVIAGEDNAGWTLDGYVIPRLASGLIWGEEIDLSHPVMKEVPWTNDSLREQFAKHYPDGIGVPE